MRAAAYCSTILCSPRINAGKVWQSGFPQFLAGQRSLPAYPNLRHDFDLLGTPARGGRVKATQPAHDVNLVNMRSLGGSVSILLGTYGLSTNLDTVRGLEWGSVPSGCPIRPDIGSVATAGHVWGPFVARFAGLA